MNKIEQTLTSREVAEMVGRRHDQVLRDVEVLISHFGDDHKSVGIYFIKSEYTDTLNRTKPCYNLTKKGCELYATRMTGKKGTQFAVAYIERFNEMEQHIENNQLDVSQFSPELQALIGIEQRQNEQDERLLEVEKKQDNIEEILSINAYNWRKTVNNIINKIAFENGGQYQSVRKKSYSDLEIRARVDLQRRLINMKNRAEKAGASRKEVTNLNYLDVIERDEKLVEIYLTIIKEMAIKYGIEKELTK